MESRREAAELILAYENRGERLDRLLGRWAERTTLSGRDAGLVRRTVMTYVARRRTVRFLVEKVSGRGMDQIAVNLWSAVAVGVLQALFLERIPAHAAVNEAVALARDWVGGRSSGFANAVLRKLLRCCAVVEGDYACGRDVIPLSAGRVLRLQSGWLPDPEKQWVQHLGVAFSQSDWFVRELAGQFERRELLSILAALNEEPPLFVVANSARTSAGDFPALFEPGCVEPTPVEGVFRLKRCGDITRLEPFRTGRMFVQDINQAKVVRKIPLQRFDNIIDVCAAPGGKTLGVLEASRGGKFVVSCDLSAGKLRELAASLTRCGFRADRCVALDGRRLHRAFRTEFDAALLDVPCSNTGALRRRVDARWRLKRSDVDELSALQLELASSAAKIVKRGGLLVYSTCSILKRENDRVVTALARRNRLKVVERELILPGVDGGDGAFVALLGKP